MTNHIYDITDGNVILEGLDSNDTLSMTGIADGNELSFLKDGDDLLLYTDQGTTLRLANHFTNTTSRMETISINGTETINLTASSIIISEASGSKTLNGDNNDNLILADDQSNNLYGYAGNDTIYSGKGNDNVFIGDGNDTVYGGGGNDNIYDDGNGDDTINGGDGNRDSAIYIYSNSAIKADLTAGTVDDDNDGITDDTLISIERIKGSAYNDEILGNSERNFLDGHDGDDIIYGYNGNDVLNGENGDDTLYGGNGNDMLISESGNNTLYGESGNDTFRFRGGNNNADGGTGTDIADYFYALNGVNVDLESGTTDTDNDGNVNDTLSSIENIKGSRHNDTLRGDNLLNDIKGDNGDDILYGGSGSDLLTGGNGSDSFVFEDLNDYAGDQYNTIKDFDSTDDFLDISDILSMGVSPIIPLANYIDVIDDGSSTTIRIDDTGLGLSYTSTVLLQGYTGHGDDAADMINEGYLII